MKKKVFCLIMGALVLSSAFAGCKITSKSSEASETSVKAAETSTVSKAEETKAAEKKETTAEKETEKATEAPVEQSEKVLYEKDGLKILYTGLGTDLIGQTIKLRIENNMGKDCIVQVNDVSVNGFMIDPLFSCDVKNGKIANDKISFFDSQLEENGITKIENVELHFTIMDTDFMHSFDTETITINP